MIFEAILDGQLTWNFYLLGSFLSVCILYILLLKSPINRLKLATFSTGICLLYLMIGSPLTAISKLSFSLHMIQMSIIYFLIPPLLLLGIPYQIFRIIPFKRVFKKQLPAQLLSTLSLYLFSLLLLLYHVPFIFNSLLQQPFIQISYEFSLFILSISMWWPIVSPDPTQRLRKGQLKRYVKQSAIMISPACLFFVFTAFIDGVNNPFMTEFIAHLCLPTSNSNAILPPPFNTKADQFMAGVCMFGLHKACLILAVKLESSTEKRNN